MERESGSKQIFVSRMSSHTKVSWEATKQPRWRIRKLVFFYPITNDDWKIGSIPSYDGNPYEGDHFITTNMKVKLDPWDREFILYPIGSPGNYVSSWKKDSLLTFDWRYTTVDDKVIALHRIYE